MKSIAGATAYELPPIQSLGAINGDRVPQLRHRGFARRLLREQVTHSFPQVGAALINTRQCVPVPSQFESGGEETK